MGLDPTWWFAPDFSYLLNTGSFRQFDMLQVAVFSGRARFKVRIEENTTASKLFF
jgi:hypothetical protein